MNTSEKFTCGDKYYFIDSSDDGNDDITISVLNGYGMCRVWHSDACYQTFDRYLIDLGPWVSLEIDAAIVTYIQHNRFAGLTPVEYLHSLGLTQ